MDINMFILYFFIYSVLGWAWEEIFLLDFREEVSVSWFSLWTILSHLRVWGNDSFNDDFTVSK